MKIVIITEYFPESAKCEVSGGVELRAFYIAKELAKKHEVTIITGRVGKTKKRERFANIEVLRPVKHEYSHGCSFLSRIKFAIGAYKKAKGLNANIIDGHNFISYIPAYFAGKKINAKKIATYQETWIGEWIKNKGLITGILGTLWERFVLRLKWDKIISGSEFTKKRLVNRGVPVEIISVVPNGVDFKKYKEIKAKKCERPTICCVSRLTKQKRIDDLIRAIVIIKRKIPEIRCKIIGVGKEMSGLHNLIKEFDIDKNVEFLGFVKSHKNVIKILKNSHVLCHPSILEGFGMVIIEAMAVGIPYVCSDIEPLREVTNNGVGGLLFKKEDYEDLSRKLLKILKNRSFYNNCVREGGKFVEKYDWMEIVSKIEEIYNEI